MKTLIAAGIRCSVMVHRSCRPVNCLTTSVQAGTTYQYTGNSFMFVSPPHTTSDFVTVMFTLAGPLAPNRPYRDIRPIAFTIFYGVQTITNFTEQVFPNFRAATGAQGQITVWRIQVSDNGLPETGTIFTSFDCPDGCGPGGNDQASVNTPFKASAFNKDPPGAWTTVGSVADTGSTLSLMTLTTYGVGSSGPAVPAGSRLSAPRAGKKSPHCRSATRPSYQFHSRELFISAHDETHRRRDAGQ